MLFKAPGRGEDPRYVVWDCGLTWLAHPTEAMQRASHALADGGDVWVVDPVDARDLDDRLATLGVVAGVVLLLDRHRRDTDELARRHDVAVHVPATLGDEAEGLGVRVKPLGGELGGTGFRVRPIIANRFWHEAALVGPDVPRGSDTRDGGTSSDDSAGNLIVAESLGTSPYYPAGTERVGVHPALRPFPPRRQFGGLRPDRLLVGHGEPVLENAAPAVVDALVGARRRAPRAYLEALAGLVRG